VEDRNGAWLDPRCVRPDWMVAGQAKFPLLFVNWDWLETKTLL